MKKIILVASAILCIAGSMLVVSCVKQKTSEDLVSSVGEVKQLSINNDMLKDIELIEAVKGLNPKYKKPEELIELLLDNAPLSAAVLQNAVNQPTLSNDFLELVYVVSAPVSGQMIDYLKKMRPDMPLAKIIQAQGKKSNTMKFAISGGDKDVQVFFGQQLSMQPNKTESECSSVITNGDEKILQITLSTSNPVELFGIFCNARKWMCGRVVAIDLSEENTLYVKCDITATNHRCFRY